MRPGWPGGRPLPGLPFPAYPALWSGYPGWAGQQLYPGLPAYHQLAAAHRLASMRSALLSGAAATPSAPPAPPAPNLSPPQEQRKRPGAQFSIDELLKHDDKRSRFEADSKSLAVTFDEVEPGREQVERVGRGADQSVKPEPQSSP